MKLELLYFEGCPNWRTVDERLRQVAAEQDVVVTHRVVSTPEEAAAISFRGSPTILVDDRDPFGRGDEPVGLTCRLYETPDGLAGSPTLDQLRDALQ